MQSSWSIKTDWAHLESGSLEERAAFAALSITAYDVCLTAGHDRILQSVREAPFLSAYHLAEWLAWNWWRLRWEPRKASTEWELSHSMASIGHGYIWPNINVLSDGRGITLVAKPSPEKEGAHYRYISNSVSFISASHFEGEVDLFIDSVLQRLGDFGVSGTNLYDVWQSVLEERDNAVMSQKRKLEALLGEDAGELDEEVLSRFLDDASVAGSSAIEEIAANRAPGQELPDVGGLVDRARREGVSGNLSDRVRADVATSSGGRHVPAWKEGAQAAQALRAYLGLAQDQLIDNQHLSSLYGAPAALLEPSLDARPLDLSLCLNEGQGRSRVLLRAKWKTGRRFELARLLGDHLLHGGSDPLRPATRSSTYRQKAQRAFAAELLCPFEAVDEMLGGDYSMESQQDVAHHFDVSDLTVRTLLVNNKRIDRSELDEVY